MQLKQAVEASQGEAFAAERQVLVYKGKILEDQTTLEQAEVSEAGFLVVTVKKAKAKQPAPPPPKAEVAEAAAPAAPAAKEAPPAPTPSPAPEGAPAARAEGAAAGASVAAEEGLIQGAASNLATGSALEAAVSSICDMGFPKEQVFKAMRAAYNNPDRAVEYLMNGMPHEEPEAPQATAPIPTGAGAGAGAGMGADAGSGAGPNTRPLNMFGAMGEGAEGGDAGGGALGFLRYNPQFQQLRQMVQANPQILQPMLQELGKQNPQLMNIISENQSEFLRLVSEAGDGAGAGTDAGMDAGAPQGDGVHGFPTAQVQISQGDKEAIDRLEGLGFDRLLCIEAFFACEKNESLAANYLLEHGHEDHMSA